MKFSTFVLCLNHFSTNASIVNVLRCDTNCVSVFFDLAIFSLWETSSSDQKMGRCWSALAGYEPRDRAYVSKCVFTCARSPWSACTTHQHLFQLQTLPGHRNSRLDWTGRLLRIYLRLHQFAISRIRVERKTASLKFSRTRFLGAYIKLSTRHVSTSHKKRLNTCKIRKLSGRFFWALIA